MSRAHYLPTALFFPACAYAPQTLTALSSEPDTSLSLKTFKDHTPEHSSVRQQAQSGPHTRMVWSLLAETCKAGKAVSRFAVVPPAETVGVQGVS